MNSSLFYSTISAEVDHVLYRLVTRQLNGMTIFYKQYKPGQKLKEQSYSMYEWVWAG